MASWVRSHLTYANVMATIAVFIALGGTSYAALQITSRNVPKDALTGADIKNLTGADVRNNTLTGADVRNLTMADFAAQERPGLAGVPGPPGPPGPPGVAGKDATPADFAGEPTSSVAAAPAGGGQCAAVAQFCTGSNNWRWRNYGNGYQLVGYWKDRGGVVHLEGVAELFGGAAGGQPAAFILPEGYRPTSIRQFPIRAGADTLRYVEVRPDGQVDPQIGGAGLAPLDGINFRP